VKGAAAGQPGEVRIVSFPEPEAQDKDAVLEVLACGICATDVKLVQKGATNTRYALGHELVGRVVHAPAGSRWALGQHVVVAPYLPCGACYYCTHGQPTLCTTLFQFSPLPGGLAERVLVPAELAERGMFPVPSGMSDELAALAEPLGCVVKGLEDSRLAAGDALLVIGDGPMGQLAAAAGKALGASPVIVAGMTDHRLANAKRHFADLVVDVNHEDLHAAVMAVTSGRGADVVLVAVSSGEALATGISMVRPGGTVNSFAGVPDGTTIDLDVRKVHYQQYFLTGSFGTAPQYMYKALDLIKNSHVEFGSVISACYPFNQTGEAVAYVERQLGLKAMVTFPALEEVH
jgi:L-iditol 2-dehydrogenase